MKDKKNRMFNNHLFIVYTVMVSIASMMFASCEIPIIETGPVVELENTQEPEIVTPEIIIEADEPEEEKIVMMKPIKVYEKYAVDENCRVLGINGKELEPVFLTDSDDKGYQFNDFFVVGGDIYFQTKEIVIDDSDPENPTSEEVIHYYSQVDNEISEFVSASDYPDKPASDFVEMGITPFSIVTFDYNGDNTSRVIKDIYEDGKLVKSLPTGFKMIDAYYSNPEGLWFSVPETISIRLKGIYFYPVDGNLSSTPVMSGRIW